MIATHSAIVVNSVSPDRIAYVERGRSSDDFRSEAQVDLTNILTSLGYRNSDLLFNDCLVFVEGPSDRLALPSLLKATGKIPDYLVDPIGFPEIHGVPGAGKPGSGSKNTKALQTSILNCEKLLSQLGRAKLSHLYLLDGDFSEQEKSLLKGTKNLLTGEFVRIEFLPRCEIENYLLDPEAIAATLADQIELRTGEKGIVTEDEVKAEIVRLLASDEKDIFPRGRIESAAEFCAKGSAVIEKIFSKWDFEYRKTEHAHLIAARITRPADDLSPLAETILSLVRNPN